MSAASRPDPRDYEDYRAYLRDMIRHLKATDRRFSYRQFSRRAGFASPNFLKLVAEGQRNLSPASIGKFARALKLEPGEHEVFETLVLLGQARTDAERNRYYRRLPRRGVPGVEMRLDQYEMYSLWCALPIREMTLLPDFRDDPEWIAARLSPRVTRAQVRRALDLLLRVGLLTRREGRLVAADVKLETPAKVPSLAVRNYHRAMLEVCAGALDRIPVAERNVTSVTVSMTRTQYEDAVSRIETLRAEILDAVEDAPRDETPRETYVLGFQVVPVTRRRGS